MYNVIVHHPVTNAQTIPKQQHVNCFYNKHYIRLVNDPHQLFLIEQIVLEYFIQLRTSVAYRNPYESV